MVQEFSELLSILLSASHLREMQLPLLASIAFLLSLSEREVAAVVHRSSWIASARVHPSSPAPKDA